jgi:hypothetical protein
MLLWFLDGECRLKVGSDGGHPEGRRPGSLRQRARQRGLLACSVSKRKVVCNCFGQFRVDTSQVIVLFKGRGGGLDYGGEGAGDNDSGAGVGSSKVN